METADLLGHWGAYDQDDPFSLFSDVRQIGPAHPVTLVDGHDAWLIIGHDEARLALGDHRLSKDMHAAMASDSALVAEGLPGRAFARHMLACDPPDHTRLRRLVSAAFTPRTVEALRPRIEIAVHGLLGDLAAHGPTDPVDVVASFAFPLPFTVICGLLGVPGSGRRALGEGLKSMLVPTSTPEEYAVAKAASDEVVAMLEALVETKRRTPGEDLVTALIAGRDGEERLSQQELMSTIFQLIVAGHDTTTSLIGNAVVALVQHPDQLAKLVDDPRRIDDVVDECMRFDAPVPHSTFRYAIEPVDIGGITIPSGAQVIICLAGANRDPRRYSNPEKFDIDRDEGRHLAFGHGPHHCLGAPLARMEGRLAIWSLFARFPQMRLAVSARELHWGHGDGLVLRGLSELPVVLGPPAS
jgi:cytochrome P450